MFAQAEVLSKKYVRHRPIRGPEGDDGTNSCTTRGDAETITVNTVVPVERLDDLLDAVRAAGHGAMDTGERVTTNAGVQAEAVVRLKVRPARD